MEQMNFTALEYANKKRKTKREMFLERMTKVIPLKEWCDIIRPFYAVKGNGREPIKLEVILKMYLVSNWFNMSDEITEDSLYDSMAMKNYVGGTPDATTLCRFRRLLEEHKLMQKIFDLQTKIFKENGLILNEGTIVDATIISSPQGTEGAKTCKNDKWHYGSKAHIGVDKQTGIVHSVTVTPANVHDVTETHKLLTGDEKELYGDAGYVGVHKRQEFQNKNLVFHICKRQKSVTDPTQEKKISQIRYIVEHAFCRLKSVFGYRRTRYRVHERNETHIYTMFLTVNLSKVF